MITEISLTPTHILDEQPLVYHMDGLNRPYFTDLKNKRVRTAGRTPEPIDEETRAKLSQTEAVPTEEISESDLTEMPFLGVAVAMAAIMIGHGYAEQGGYCAHRCGDRAATLSVPQVGGGHIRYRVEFPEIMHLALEEAE